MTQVVIACRLITNSLHMAMARRLQEAEELFLHSNLVRTNSKASGESRRVVLMRKLGNKKSSQSAPSKVKIIMIVKIVSLAPTPITMVSKECRLQNPKIITKTLDFRAA